MAITKLKALGVTANTITASQIANNTITNTQINASAAIAASKLGSLSSTVQSNLPAGSVLQVKQSTKTDTQYIQNTTLQVITGLDVTITPSSASNKMMLFASPSLSGNGHLDAVLQRTVGGTETILFRGDASGDRTRSHWHQYVVTNFNTSYEMKSSNMQFLDSPNTTSAITYKVLAGTPHDASSYFVYVNRQASDGSAAWAATTASTFTVMEIKG